MLKSITMGAFTAIAVLMVYGCTNKAQIERPDGDLVSQECSELNSRAVMNFMDFESDSVAVRENSISLLERAANMCLHEADIYVNLVQYLAWLGWGEEAMIYAEQWYDNNKDSSMYDVYNFISKRIVN